MKSKKLNTKLIVNKQTVANLGNREMGNAVGGSYVTHIATNCAGCTIILTCPCPPSQNINCIPDKWEF